MSDGGGSAAPSAGGGASGVASAPGASVPQRGAVNLPPGGKPPADATSQAAEQPKPKAPPKEFTFKIDGKERVERFDEEQQHRTMQLGLAAHERMREAARMKQEAESFTKSLETKGLDALREKYGAEAVNQMIWSEVQKQYSAEKQYEQVPAEQRAIMEERDRLRKQIEERDQRERETKTAAEARAKQEQKQRYAKQRLSQLAQAFQGAGYKEADPYMVEELTPIAAELWEDIPDLAPDEAVKLAHEMADRRVASTLSRVDDARLETMLGEPRLKALMRRYVDRLRGTTAPVATPEGGEEPAPAEPLRIDPFNRRARLAMSRGGR